MYGKVEYEKLLDIFPSNYLFIPFLFAFLLPNYQIAEYEIPK